MHWSTSSLKKRWRTFRGETQDIRIPLNGFSWRRDRKGISVQNPKEAKLLTSRVQRRYPNRSHYRSDSPMLFLCDVTKIFWGDTLHCFSILLLELNYKSRITETTRTYYQKNCSVKPYLITFKSLLNTDNPSITSAPKVELREVLCVKRSMLLFLSKKTENSVEVWSNEFYLTQTPTGSTWIEWSTQGKRGNVQGFTYNLVLPISGI